MAALRFGFVFGSMIALAPLPAAASLLDDVPVGATIEIPSFDVGNVSKNRDTFAFRRIDVYAPGARIYLVDSNGVQTEIPRSERRYYVSADAGLSRQMYFSTGPDGRDVQGVLFGPDGAVAFEGVAGKSSIEVRSSRKVEDEDTEYTCASDGVTTKPKNLAPSETASSGHRISKGTATHEAVVAIDTDTELLSLKFGNNTTTAANYLAELFTGLNVYYERDLAVRLVQGDTFLRVGSDPYIETSTIPQLHEVGSVWFNTPALQAVDRAFVMFLSGKSPANNRAAGVAWQLDIGNYCAETGNPQPGGAIAGHYSVTQVFKLNASAANDIGIVGHELGHNFGVAHTHCTNRTTGADPVSTNTIDQCFRVEPACYSGAVSCPTDNSISGQGSIMSYCNFSAPNGASCAPNGGQVLKEFHPVHQTLLDARVATNIANGCLTAVQDPQANLSVSINDGGASVVRGNDIVFGVGTSNAGPNDASNVRVDYPLPAGTNFVSASGSGWSCSNVSGTIRCTRATLIFGASAPITITIGVPGGYAGANPISSSATITSDTSDPVPGNNSSSDTTLVVTPDPNGIFCDGLENFACIP
jgi:uncharacterized repeat protein (TIGR01451 family)